MKNKFLSLICIAVLSSCSHTPNFNKDSTPDEAVRDNFHGYYKVGTPYEIDGQMYYPKEEPDYDKTGIASWYGDEFHGKLTANGDTFDRFSLTAAHNTLPLPSMVRVTNLENNKTLILMVNDRGPFAKGRVIDVSERASEILGFKDKGIARVRVQFLPGQTKRLLSSLPKDPNAKPSAVNTIASFFGKSDNEEIIDDLAPKEPSYPMDLMPDSAKDALMKPVNKIGDMIKSAGKNMANQNAPAPTKTEISDLPEIKISNNDTQTGAIEATEPFEPEITYIDDKIIEADNSPTVGMTDDEARMLDDAIANMSEPLKEPEEELMEPQPEEKQITQNKITGSYAANNIEVIENTPQNFVQAGTFGVKQNAERTKKLLEPIGNAFIQPIERGSRTLYRVRIGPIKRDDIAKIALDKTIKLGNVDAIIVRDILE